MYCSTTSNIRRVVSSVLIITLLAGMAAPATAGEKPDPASMAKHPALIALGVVAAIAGIGRAIDYIARDNYSIGAVSEKCGAGTARGWGCEDSGWDSANCDMELGTSDTPGSQNCGSAEAHAYANDATFSDATIIVWIYANRPTSKGKVDAYAKGTADGVYEIDQSKQNDAPAKFVNGVEVLSFERTMELTDLTIQILDGRRGKANVCAGVNYRFEYADGDWVDVPGVEFSFNVDPRGDLTVSGIPNEELQISQSPGGGTTISASNYVVTDIIDVPRYSAGGAPMETVTQTTDGEASAMAVGDGEPWIDASYASSFQDAFSEAGVTDWYGDPNALLVRTDAAVDLAGPQAGWIDRQDQMIVSIFPDTVGGSIVGPGPSGGPMMTYVIETNPMFDEVRQLPPGLEYFGVDERGRNRWVGFLEGVPLGNFEYGFDFPENELSKDSKVPAAGFFFPGDEIRYMIEAEDQMGYIGSVPEDASTLYDGTNYDHRYTVQGLPSVKQESWGVVQAQLLIIQALNEEDDDALQQALRESGMIEGLDYDVYRVADPASMYSNSIAAAGSGGATLAQLMGYSAIMVVGAEHGPGVLGDGTNANGNGKNDDLSLLAQYAQNSGGALALMGGRLLKALNDQGPAAVDFLRDELGVEVVEERELPGAGVVNTMGFYPFTTSFASFEQQPTSFPGCNEDTPDLELVPTWAQISHQLTGPTGETYVVQVATENGSGHRLASLFDPSEISSSPDPSAPNGARGQYMTELMEFINVVPWDSPTSTPTTARAVMQVGSAYPNPFNPRTQVDFSVERPGQVTAHVYDLRGRTVRTLLDADVAAGSHSLMWDGTADNGASVASGVYMLRLVSTGAVESRKLVLAK